MLLAHGVGSRGDLPLPLWMFIWAAAIALVISFVALGALWTKPRLATAAEGRQLLATTSTWILAVVWPLRLVALLLFTTALLAGLLGENNTGTNLLPVTFYVVVWVGAQVLGGLVGDLWRVISPLTTISMVVERVMPANRPAPSWALSQWPAAAGLAVFLFYELAHPTGSEPRTLAWMLLAHTVICIALAARFGSDWVRDHEPFGALFSMVGALGPVGTDARHRCLRLRLPLTGLANMPVAPGTLAVLLVVLGGTTFDGFSESRLGRDILGTQEGWSGAAVRTVGLFVSVGVVAALYAAGVWWTRRTTDRDGLADSFAPSLVPIVFGYAIAHYAQLLVDEIQTFVFRLSDPGGAGWDLFGGADGRIDFTIVSPSVIAWIQVLAVLVGHIGAVIVAHDRSVELFTLRESLRSQYSMLLVMVAYSTLGLWLLLNA